MTTEALRLPCEPLKAGNKNQNSEESFCEFLQSTGESATHESRSQCDGVCLSLSCVHK